MAVTKQAQSQKRQIKKPRLDTALPSSPANRPGCSHGHLCEKCKKIDFHAFLIPSSIRPVFFSGLSRDATCSFCHYVRKIAKDDSGVAVDQEVLDQCRFRIEQRTVPVMDRLRASQMLVAPRLVVSAFLQPPDDSSSLATCLVMLELDGKDVIPIWRANAFWTSRRPRPPHLDVSMLKDWMETAQAMEQQPQSKDAVDADAASLQALIGRGYFRVLDVTTSQVVVLKKAESFLALSYVWGRIDLAAMIEHNAQQASPRPDLLQVCWTLDVNRAPKTIRDAIALVRSLGEKYLWIDSLCIDQASATDKSTVILEMKSIYRSAVLTIVAAEGDSADAGLRRLACGQDVEQPLIILQDNQRLHLYPALASLEDTIKGTVWNERGWTFQERVLSKACVYFTRDEVLFSSGGVIEREAYAVTNNPGRPLSTYRRKTPSIGKQATLQGALSRPIVALDHKIHRYKEAVTEFTRRKLTHRGDRLDAFSGILALLEDNNQADPHMQAFSGLLHAPTQTIQKSATPSGLRSARTAVTSKESPFLASLLWHPRVPVTKAHRIWHNATETRALPSWSWAGWACEVHYPKRDNPSSDLSGTRILNENNVQYTVSEDERYPTWPSEPELPELRAQEAFVLHLWRPVLRGRLELYGENTVANPRGWSTYQIIMPDARSPEKQLCLIDVAHEFVQTRAADHLYEFVPIDSKREVFAPRDILLVQSKGKYHERVALSYGTPLWMEHLRQIESQHIRLI